MSGNNKLELLDSLDDEEDGSVRFSDESSSEGDEAATSSESDAEDNLQPENEWSDINNLHNLPYTSAPRYNTDTAEYPIDYFNLLFTNTFLAALVSSINTHAVEVLFETEGKHSNITRWIDTHVKELRVFLALLFHMGHIKVNTINDYWKRTKLYNLPFPQFMSRDRFLLLLRTLYYTDEFNYSNPIISPTQPIINFFNDRMNELVTPLRNLTIDEALVLWRGRLWQHAKGKRHKQGVKLYSLTDVNGLCLKLQMYSGASDPVVGGKGYINKIVILLLENYLNKGYAVYMDDYYNSIELAETLLVNNTYVTGTLQSHRSHNPSFVATKIPKGSCIFKFNRRGVCIANFTDKKQVLAISTQYSGEMTKTLNNRKVSVLRPQMIVEYNKYMKRIDRKDQLLSYYSSCSKSMCWYKKIVIHILQVMLLNAYIIYIACNTTDKMSFYEFRVNVVKSLLNISDDNPSDELSDKDTSHLQTTNKGEIIHLPVGCPKVKERTKRRRCALCFKKHQRRKQVLFYCPKCPQQPGLCLTCFREFHNY